MTAISSSQMITQAALVAGSFITGYALGRTFTASANAQRVAELLKDVPHPNIRVQDAAGVEVQDETDEPNDEEESDDDDVADGDLASVKAGTFEQCKLVLCVRTDLKMSTGKISAQHATLACYKALVARNPQLVRHWEHTGQAKIALKVTSEEQMLELEAIAKSLNLCARSIQDAGHTQVAEGSRTVLGIGPAPVKLINEVTGALRLL